MKKCLLLILTLLSLSLTAQAAEEIDVNIKGKGTEISISGAAAANAKASVFVAKSIRAEDYLDVVFTNEVMCDSTGDFTAVFNMPDKFDADYDATGTYTVYVAADGFDRVSKPLEYVSLKKQNELLGILNGKTFGDEIKALFLDASNKNAFSSMGINIDGYTANPKLQKDIADVLFASKPYSDIAGLEAKYNDAFATALINNSSDVAALKNELVSGGYISFIVDGEDITKDSGMFDFAMDYLLAHKKYRDSFAAQKAVKDGVVAYKLKNANKVSLTELVKGYADYIGVKTHARFSAYENSATMQLYVNEKTILALPAGGANSIEEFVAKFTEALASYTASAPGGGGGGTGPGSGSGGSGSGFGGIVSGLPSSFTASSEAFSDMENAGWAKDAVEYLHKKGIVHGTGENTFSPNEYVTREQFTKMMVEFAGMSNEAEIAFEDVENGAWYCKYIKIAYANGLVSGVSEKHFGTGNSMTREDAAVIIKRCMDTLSITAEDKRDDAEIFDYDDISDYAKESVRYLYKKGIISGVAEGVFAPKATVTRAQTAKMIYELCRVRGDVI